MSINRQDSRHRIKRSNLTGVTPTAHTASTDFTDGTWLNTDIREGEFFYNIPDVRLWVGTGTSSREIEFVGGTAGGESLADTLVVGNTTGANDIIVDVDRQIKTTDTGFIQFGDGGAGDLNTIVISNGGDGITTNAANMGFSGADAYLTLQTIDYASTITDTILLDPQGIGGGTGITSLNTTTNEASYAFVYPTEFGVIVNDPTLINQGSIGVHSYGIDIITSNSVIGVTDQISLDPTNLLNGTGIKSIDTTSGDSSEINITPIYLGISSTTQVNISSNNFVNIQAIELRTNLRETFVSPQVVRVERGATITTSSVGTQSISSITSMVNNQMISIDGRISGYCSSPNRAYSVKFYAVFEKYGGTIYQVGTTDLTVKDNYGDGTTVDISTDGTDILINVVPNNTLSINWNTIYDYIITL